LKKILFFLILGSSTVFAGYNPLLVCLGKEEGILHQRKKAGPNYQLNQYFINSLVGFNHIPLKEEYLKKICSEGDFSYSVSLLEQLLLRGVELFNLSNVANQRISEVVTIDELLEDTPQIFIRYLASLQEFAQTPDCLPKRVKNLKYFLDRLTYLEEDFGGQAILKNRKKITELFADLKKLDHYYEECKAEAKKNEPKPKVDPKETEEQNPDPNKT
jgi:hypothetical protein